MNEPSHAEVRAITWRRALLWAIGAAALLAVIYFGGRALLERNGPVRLVVYAFSTQEEALTQAVFPAFEAAWEAETGRELNIEGIFGPSATLAGQINLGAPADVAVFSNEQDVTRIKVGKQVDRNAQGQVISYTPMVIVTRPGNAAGQEALVRYHWRPAQPDGSALPPLRQPFTVQELGGWSKASAEVIDGLWQKRILPQLVVETVGPLSTRSP